MILLTGTNQITVAILIIITPKTFGNITVQYYYYSSKHNITVQNTIDSCQKKK